MCGWKSDSCLSEIASESNKRRMPDNRRERFALATGCNLLNQYAARQEMLRLAAGKRDECHSDQRLRMALIVTKLALIDESHLQQAHIQLLRVTAGGGPQRSARGGLPGLTAGWNGLCKRTHGHALAVVS